MEPIGEWPGGNGSFKYFKDLQIRMGNFALQVTSPTDGHHSTRVAVQPGFDFKPSLVERMKRDGYEIKCSE
jgi:hypothetical protein